MSPPEPFLIDRVRHAVVADRLLRRGERVLVAVSGGPDSLVLLHLLTKLKGALQLRLYVAHVDHQLRASSAEDARFVEALAQRLKLPVVVERRDVQTLCRANDWSLEEGARRIRYDCLREVARRYSASAVALGHTADDQAETVLMRLLRGTGVMGLRAMAPRRLLSEDLAFGRARRGGGHDGGGGIWLVRPLLSVSRREVLGYLRQEGLTARHDETNDDPRFLRNRIRQELLPLLERYNPRIKAALTQLAEQSRSEHDYLAQAAAKQGKRVVARVGEREWAIDVRAMNRQPEALRRQLVRDVIRHLHGSLTAFEFRHWVEIDRLLQRHPDGAVVDLPGGLRFIREGPRIRCQQSSLLPVR